MPSLAILYDGRPRTSWPPKRIAPARAGEVLRSCLDASRAHELLGWEPQVPLADGLALTLAAVSAPRAA